MKTWNVTIMHPTTKATSNAVVYARDRMEATRIARTHYAPVCADGSCYKITSVVEMA